ncbi:hypothetical protein ZTR_06839 [Talaromyces verruculosus]|nr:hypothetical protein ZTR_06839 [Talaromyces verruculosus]
MKSLGGTIFPTTTATTQEGIDYDDEDEDSPASTIVPPSPVGSRRNSLMNNGATTEEAEDIITSSGDHLSSSVAYGEAIQAIQDLHPVIRNSPVETLDQPPLELPESMNNEQTISAIQTLTEQNLQQQREADFSKKWKQNRAVLYKALLLLLKHLEWRTAHRRQRRLKRLQQRQRYLHQNYTRELRSYLG